MLLHANSVRAKRRRTPSQPSDIDLSCPTHRLPRDHSAPPDVPALGFQLDARTAKYQPSPGMLSVQHATTVEDQTNLCLSIGRWSKNLKHPHLRGQTLNTVSESNARWLRDIRVSVDEQLHKKAYSVVLYSTVHPKLKYATC